MSETDPFGAIAAYYDALVARYGHHPRACDYGRAESQRVKFRVLSEVMPLAGLSLLDVGCGFAGYADVLPSDVDCTGIAVTAARIVLSPEPAAEMRAKSSAEAPCGGTAQRLRVWHSPESPCAMWSRWCSALVITSRFSTRLSALSPLTWWTCSLAVSSRPRCSSITIRCSRFFRPTPVLTEMYPSFRT